MSGACRAHGDDNKCVQNFPWQTSKFVDADWRLILKWILGNRVGECGLDSCGSG
jgi:hypothetical protein